MQAIKKRNVLIKMTIKLDAAKIPQQYLKPEEGKGRGNVSDKIIHCNTIFLNTEDAKESEEVS